MGAFQPLGSLIPALSYFCVQAASRVQCIAKQQINQHPTFFGSDSKVTSFITVLYFLWEYEGFNDLRTVLHYTKKECADSNFSFRLAIFKFHSL